MDPYNSLSFKKKDLDFKDTVVTLLIVIQAQREEGNHNCCDMCRYFIRTLERCSVKVEIWLYYQNWKGGKSREFWNKKAQNAGRLNDLRHIIYKE